MKTPALPTWRKIYLAWHKIYLAWHKIYLAWHKIYLAWRKIYLAWRKIYLAGPARLLENPRFYSLTQRLISANYRAVRRAIRRELGPLPDQRVIDLGCGTGTLAGEFGDARYVGVDIDLAYIRFARGVTRERFAAMDVTKLALQDDTFDAALAVGLVHHLDDHTAKQFTRQVQRVCRDGAPVLIIDIILPGWWNLPERARQRWAERGRFVRPPEAYRALWTLALALEKAYRVRSGFLEYQVLVLRVGKFSEPRRTR